MFKQLLNLICILLTMVSTKLVYCYTCLISFIVMLVNIIFPSLTKKYNSKSASLDQDELEILKQQISSSFTKVQSSDTFPVSMDSSFNSHVALDVIESQNQRYQDYIKFKQQMKKKQNKNGQLSQLILSTSTNMSDNQYLNVNNSYRNEASVIESTNVLLPSTDGAACESENKFYVANSQVIQDFKNTFQNKCYLDNSNDNKCLAESKKENYLGQISIDCNCQDLECEAKSTKKQVHQRNPIKNYTSYYLTNLNRKYNSKLNAKSEIENNYVDEKASQDDQDFEEELEVEEEEDISTEDSSANNSEDEDTSNQQKDQENSEKVEDQDQLQEFKEQTLHQGGDRDIKQNYLMNQQVIMKPQPQASPFQPKISKMRSTDQNIEQLNQQVIQTQLHNYFNLDFLQIKKVKIDSNFNFHEQLETICSRKRCPCLKFKRRFQRVRSVLANKTKLPTILENFAY
ncbi:transmembrane protein, putative (macronuclear) [Tetrahymena thermophila SB210]|uniref:Transmembrane protein, putative n=1 Tax=Tetrahymena thermophila (strain SB210) TaxID=312017 RepID=I7MI47_TETTS|nr:transmembrane protein, putative [Tetrahymena thermophila SB210]EAR90872.1 transmembrane protein, putative [Tetrahymena thermophila SB210]|eukprot:XP_001011117.1 transmembrane protein, putative [Tetrahymena thermophila SB210]